MTVMTVVTGRRERYFPWQRKDRPDVERAEVVPLVGVSARTLLGVTKFDVVSTTHISSWIKS